MEIYRILGKRQMLVVSLCFLLIVGTMLTAFDGAASVSSSTQSKLLPIYSVGREPEDKIISISYRIFSIFTVHPHRTGIFLQFL